jgi:hypothetical protein
MDGQRILYHATHRDNLASICEHGLVPTSLGPARANWERYSIVSGGVYLSPVISACESFRVHSLSEQLLCDEQDIEILRVSADGAHLHPDPERLTQELARIYEDHAAEGIEAGDELAAVKPLIDLMAPDWPSEIYDATGRAMWEAYWSLSNDQRSAIMQWVTAFRPMSLVHLGPIAPDRIEGMALMSENDTPYPDDIAQSSMDDYDDSFARYYQPWQLAELEQAA